MNFVVSGNRIFLQLSSHVVHISVQLCRQNENEVNELLRAESFQSAPISSCPLPLLPLPGGVSRSSPRFRPQPTCTGPLALLLNNQDPLALVQSVLHPYNYYAVTLLPGNEALACFSSRFYCGSLPSSITAKLQYWGKQRAARTEGASEAAGGTWRPNNPWTMHDKLAFSLPGLVKFALLDCHAVLVLLHNVCPAPAPSFAVCI